MPCYVKTFYLNWYICPICKLCISFCFLSWSDSFWRIWNVDMIFSAHIYSNNYNWYKGQMNHLPSKESSTRLTNIPAIVAMSARPGSADLTQSVVILGDVRPVARLSTSFVVANSELTCKLWKFQSQNWFKWRLCKFNRKLKAKNG